MKNYPKSGHGFLSIPESIVFITLQMGSYRIKYRLFSEHLKPLPIITILYYIEKGSFFRKRIFIKTEEIHLITKVCRFLEFVSSQMTFTILKGAHVILSLRLFLWNTSGNKSIVLDVATQMVTEELVNCCMYPSLCWNELRLGTRW